jgi:hypothetical protein
VARPAGSGCREPHGVACDEYVSAGKAVVAARSAHTHGHGVVRPMYRRTGGLCGRAERSCDELGVDDDAPGGLGSRSLIPTSPGRRIQMTMLRICSAGRTEMTS